MDYHEDYYKGMSKVYFNKILATIIRLGNLKSQKGMILDFGCGHQYLKKRLPSQQVIGYDIIPALSDVEDYRILKPEVIVCNNILEHFTQSQIHEKIREFKEMNKSCTLITATPTENWLSKVGMFITGMTNAHDDHKSKLKEINSILEGYCNIQARKKVYTLSEVSVWKWKN